MPSESPSAASSPSKGEATRQQIVDTALRRAAELGLEGVTLGRLAEELGLSKSGLFAHFKSKEALQLAVLEEAVERFSARVPRAALSAPRGAPRVRAVAERWIDWFTRSNPLRGCFFLSLASEYDDRPGAVRDALVTSQRRWRDFLAGAARMAIDQGHFHTDLDPEQFAFEFSGIGMSLQFSAKLVADPLAVERARRAFEQLIHRSSVSESA